MEGPFALPDQSPLKAGERRIRRGFLPRGFIDALTLSNDTTDATNDIAIAAGAARSQCNVVDGTTSTFDRDQIDLELPVSIIKQIDVAFAPDNYDRDGYSGGDRSGGRSPSSLSNTTWQVFLIGGRGVPCDVFFHDSATQSSVLTELLKLGGYTAYRHIGAIVRSSGSILTFVQFGDTFLLKSPVLDVTNTSDHTTAATGTLSSCPTGVSVEAILNIGCTNSAGSNNGTYVSSLDQTDATPSVTAAPGLTVSANNETIWVGNQRVKTNTSAQVRYRASASTISTKLVTCGWVHPRGRDL